MTKLMLLAVLIATVVLASATFAGLEITMDSLDGMFGFLWSPGTAPDSYGSIFGYIEVVSSWGDEAVYTPNIPATASDWQVHAWYPTVANAYAATKHVIHHAGGDSTIYVDQTSNQGSWVYLGTFAMNAGTGNSVTVSNEGTDTSKVVLADGFRFYSASTQDTAPPVITDVAALTDADPVSITWTTDESSTTQVEYGLTTAYGIETTNDSTLVTAHSVQLPNLPPATLYHYRVKSEDAEGNLAVSPDHTFTTPMPEYRAAWADAFHSGFLSSWQLDTMMDTLEDANINVLIPEVRKYADAYYDSAYEPRATNIQTPPPFDPLQEMIAQGHAAGIEIHPWIVTYRVWSSSYGSPPADHVWALHPDWVMKDRYGSNIDGTTYNLDPGVPGVQDYICKVVMDIVGKYDVDGFNFDYIRYPGTYWGYNEYTKERFNQDYGYYPPTYDNGAQWDNWCDFRRQQVTDLVKKCYLEVMAIKPHVKLSVDTVGWMGTNPITNFAGTRQYSEVYQDSERWMRDQIIDMNVLMNYKREHDSAQYADFRLWTDWLTLMGSSSGRHSVDGLATYLNSIAGSLTQINYARSAGNDGVCFYSYASTNKDSQPAADFWNAVKTGPFATKVPVPDMPWKSSPTTGIIFGTITKAFGAPDPIYEHWLCKATVSVSGPVIRNTTTDGTGTYGFLDLPPGTYTVTITKPGYPARVISGVIVEAGSVVRRNAALGSNVVVTSPAGIVSAGWNLISLPMEPVNPDPATVFAGIEIDSMLYRWDNPTQGLCVYDTWSPEQFGGIDVASGYWLESAAGGTISYQAYPSNDTERTIELVEAGWAIIGCPFQTQRNWADTMVRHGRYYEPMSEAEANGWMNSVGYWWDSSTQGLNDMGLPEDFAASEVLQPWHGYWIETYEDHLTLTLR